MDLSEVLRYSVMYFIAGSVFKFIGDGHWTDYTKPIHNVRLRFACQLMSFMCLFCAFQGLMCIVFPGSWGSLLSLVAAVAYIHNESSL